MLKVIFDVCSIILIIVSILFPTAMLINTLFGNTGEYWENEEVNFDPTEGMQGEGGENL